MILATYISVSMISVYQGQFHDCIQFVNSCALSRFFPKGIEDPDQDDDGLIDQPLQIISEVPELEESDDAEVLFEPPPMFAR